MSLVGSPVTELDTPTLLVDLDLLSVNVCRIATLIGETGAR